MWKIFNSSVCLCSPSTLPSPFTFAVRLSWNDGPLCLVGMGVGFLPVCLLTSRVLWSIIECCLLSPLPQRLDPIHALGSRCIHLRMVELLFVLCWAKVQLAWGCRMLPPVPWHYHLLGPETDAHTNFTPSTLIPTEYHKKGTSKRKEITISQALPYAIGKVS